MRIPTPVSLILLLLSLLAVVSAAQDFDFFYFVQQWPGSYCDTAKSCCYPTTGKPAADFGIHGLWPNYNDGSYPSNCDPDNDYDESKIKDLITAMEAEWPTLACPSGDGSKFWSHEWEKHGTCSESILDEHSYFEAALSLKKQADILQSLKSAGIEPDGGFYSVSSISRAIKDATGFTPGIECNVDESGNTQLYQVYVCVDANAKDLIECPVYPRSKCSSSVEFPTF
ncbi:extracellular ribonuclease LE-like [Phoenix dactylifera]|uniref:Extracellular ribonuclease LE-like n=1 Tax=Phoenix dactylifera TaxID=42345 RepID=A0A8B7CMV2_PHODC|nr:extracellular ribonuclease LE-like [Phoenix dactylifera]